MGGKLHPTLLDMLHPVGEYYETSNTSFDPNVTWGGTWVKETDERVLVAAGSTIAVGATGGEKTHTLTTNEMPAHKHSLTSWRNPKEYTPQPTTGFGFTNDNYAFSNVATNGDGTSYTTNNSVAIGSTGGNQAHNNMQPYKGVVRWHRTA